MGIRIDGTSDLINATDGSLTIEGQSINTTGIVTAASLVTADKIIHNGDTNTAIRFPANDTISFEAGGEEHCRVVDTGNFLVGATAVEDWDGSRSHRIQVRGTSSNNAGISALITANDDNPSELVLGKSRGTGNTIVGSGDDIGQIRFSANDGAGFHSVAWIRSTMDGTPGSDDLPSNLRFGTSADGGATVSERLRIDSSGRLLVGHTAAYGSSKAQIFNTAQYLLDLSAWSADANGPTIDFYKSRNATIGSATVVQSGDVVGKFRFLGNDGANSRTAAQISAEVDGTPGTNDMPGRLVFGTTIDGGSSPTERMRIKNDGRILISSDISTVNVPLLEIYNTAAQSQEGACLKLRSGRGGGVKDTAILGIHDNVDREFFRVQNDGVVGVNTVTFNTGSKLEVSSEGAYGIISRSQNGNGGYHVFTGQSSGGTNTSYITHNGRGYFEDGVQFDSSGEVLDSYEEGTWTPVPENTNNTPTYHNQSGIYTKIGNLVTVVGFLQFNNAPTFTSNDSELRVTGLPFTANGTGYMNTVGNVTFQSLNWSGSTYNDYGAEGNLVCGVVENTKNVFKVNPAGNNLIRGTLRREAFEGGGIITWSMTYKTNS